MKIKYEVKGSFTRVKQKYCVFINQPFIKLNVICMVQEAAYFYSNYFSNLAGNAISPISINLVPKLLQYFFSFMNVRRALYVSKEELFRNCFNCFCYCKGLVLIIRPIRLWRNRAGRIFQNSNIQKVMIRICSHLYIFFITNELLNVLLQPFYESLYTYPWNVVFFFVCFFCCFFFVVVVVVFF